MQRRLTAILAADVVDYSRLMGADESGTLRSLKDVRTRLFEPLIDKHSGHVVKRMGDGWLVEFASIADATACAIAIQNQLVGHDLICLRIGVHLGDVTFDDEDIYGDGVNVAARLEASAMPGGVMISDTAYQSLDGKTIAHFRSGGIKQLKNIAREVQVWNWVDGPVPSQTLPEPGAAGRRKMPAIAILPFSNLSNDPEQDYFADGISEDIITELSRFPDLLVISRSSSFPYKNRNKDVSTICRDLGARYLLEGSVRKGGTRVRVAAQLTDGTSGEQIWAERYDRQLLDIFELQDEITQNVVASVPERVEGAEVKRVKRAKTTDMSAYEYVIRGKQHHHKGTPDDNAEALRLLEKAIEVDPEYAPAYAWKACTLGQAIALGVPEDPQTLLEENLRNVNLGLALDENDIECHRILCEFGMYYGDWAAAERHHARAHELNPNDARIIAQRGELFAMTGKAQEGVAWIEKAMQLDPINGDSRVHLLARANFAAKKYGDAIKAYLRIANPKAEYLAELAACYAMLAMTPEAAETTAKLLAKNPDFKTSTYLAGRKFKDDADLTHLAEALNQTNLPD